MSGGHLDPRPHSVYRCWSEDGDLLYVGCSVNVRARLAAHRRGAPWWPQVAKVTTVDYVDGFGGFWAEKAAIQSERPRFNVAIKDGPSDWTACGVLAEIRRVDRQVSA